MALLRSSGGLCNAFAGLAQRKSSLVDSSGGSVLKPTQPEVMALEELFLTKASRRQDDQHPSATGVELTVSIVSKQEPSNAGSYLTDMNAASEGDSSLRSMCVQAALPPPPPASSSVTTLVFCPENHDLTQSRQNSTGEMLPLCSGGATGATSDIKYQSGNPLNHHRPKNLPLPSLVRKCSTPTAGQMAAIAEPPPQHQLLWLLFQSREGSQRTAGRVAAAAAMGPGTLHVGPASCVNGGGNGIMMLSAEMIEVAPTGGSPRCSSSMVTALDPLATSTFATLMKNNCSVFGAPPVSPNTIPAPVVPSTSKPSLMAIDSGETGSSTKDPKDLTGTASTVEQAPSSITGPGRTGGGGGGASIRRPPRRAVSCRLLLPQASVDVARAQSVSRQAATSRSSRALAFALSLNTSPLTIPDTRPPSAPPQSQPSSSQTPPPPPQQQQPAAQLERRPQSAELVLKGKTEDTVAMMATRAAAIAVAAVRRSLGLDNSWRGRSEASRTLLARVGLTSTNLSAVCTDTGFTAGPMTVTTGADFTMSTFGQSSALGVSNASACASTMAGVNGSIIIGSAATAPRPNRDDVDSSDGTRKPNAPVKRQSTALPEGDQQQECWHEVWMNMVQDPVTDQYVVLITQVDVTAKVIAERHLALVMETEHRLVEQLFPRHILQYITEEWTGGQVAAAAAVAAPGGAEAEAEKGGGGSGGGGGCGGVGSMPNGGDSFPWRPVVRDCNALATCHAEVTLLFADIKGFTPMCDQLEPQQVMSLLNALYSRYDAMLDKYGVYKVETIGDCYFVAGGLIHEDEDGMAAVREGGSSEDPLHAEKVFMFAKAMLSAAREVLMPTTGQPVEIRIGLHTGPVVSGVVGTRMPRFCLFGDTVNTASRMESTGVPGTIHASEATYKRLQRSDMWEPTGGVEVKGKGLMPTYLWRAFIPNVPSIAHHQLPARGSIASNTAGGTAVSASGVFSL